jgi:hypothetical protein
MVRTRFVYMLLLLAFCLIGEYKDQAIVVYTIAFLCTHHSHHVLLLKQLGWHTDWPKESLKDMKTISFVLYLHMEFIWECCSQIQIMRICCDFLKQRFLHFYSFRPRKKLSEKWFFKLSRIVHSPPSCTRLNFTQKEWGLQVNYCQIITTSQSILSSSPYKTEFCWQNFDKFPTWNYVLMRFFIAQIQ